ncbi:MAG: porin family protein [Flavobacteriaceae bacterium]
MKKLIFLSLISIFLLSSCVTPRYGVKVGGNYATIGGDDTDNIDGKIGLYLGGVAELGITDRFAVQPEVLFSQQGAKYSDSGGFDGQFNFNYINVPIMAKFKPSDAFSIELGPQIGFLLTAKDKFDSPTSGEDDIKDFVGSTDFGGNIGIGYELDMGLNFNARFNYGFSNINDFDTGGLDISNNNCVFSLGVGWMF